MNDSKSNARLILLARRQMLQATAGLATTLAASSGGTLAAETAGLHALDLGGDMWTPKQEGSARSVAAIVPGRAHTNLLKASTIPDPFYLSTIHGCCPPFPLNNLRRTMPTNMADAVPS